MSTTLDKTIARAEGFLKRFRDKPDWEVREIACGHDVAIDMPEELMRVLVAAA
jgi:hypothetical protein